MRLDVLIGLVLVFTPLSLAAVGGVSSVFASIQHQSVEVHHWVTNREFVELFAIARGTPGPGSMLVTLIGWKAAGLAGAITATLALYLPSSILALVVSKLWGRFSGRAWHKALQAGLAPVGVGLMIAAIATIFQAVGTGLLSWIVAVGAALTMNFFPNTSPLILLGAGGAIFFAFGG
jgi:chromate transporter